MLFIILAITLAGTIGFIILYKLVSLYEIYGDYLAKMDKICRNDNTIKCVNLKRKQVKMFREIAPNKWMCARILEIEAKKYFVFFYSKSNRDEALSLFPHMQIPMYSILIKLPFIDWLILNKEQRDIEDRKEIKEKNFSDNRNLAKLMSYIQEDIDNLKAQAEKEHEEAHELLIKIRNGELK